GLTWQAPSLTTADMEFMALKEGAARDIALAFGVPPVLVGLPGDATYANAREAGRALYRQTILPMAGRVLDALAGMLSDWLGPVTLTVDTDQISELAEDRAALWQAVGVARRQADGMARGGRLAGADRAGRAADRDRRQAAVDRPDGERVRFAGYAAIFDRPDKGGDIIRKGAFARALDRAGEIPLLW